MKKTLVLLSIASVLVWATPSTQIWNPATDVQAKGTFHLGIDNYFGMSGALSASTMFPVDLGLEYGLMDNLEVGLDLFYPNGDAPVALNAKYAIPEANGLPAMAVGIFCVGLKANDGITDMRTMYGLFSKNLGEMGRVSAGYYLGNDKVLLDISSAVDNKGVILTYDKALNDKWWVCVDYAGGKSAMGSTFVGL
ncbi:MAG: hypothetical protein AABZ14_04275, partial [Candidatus Margulisiibacteriota bacterium]